MHYTEYTFTWENGFSITNSWENNQAFQIMKNYRKSEKVCPFPPSSQSIILLIRKCISAYFLYSVVHRWLLDGT